MAKAGKKGQDMRTQTAERVVRVTATRARLAKPEVTAEEILIKEDNKTVYQQRVLAAPLDRLDHNGIVTTREYLAGDQLRKDAFYAEVAKGARSVNWDNTGGSPGRRSFIPALVAEERLQEFSDRYERAKKAFQRNQRVWPVLVNGLVHEHSFREIGHNVFGFRDDREATVAGRTAFCMALSVLADHYGL